MGIPAYFSYILRSHHGVLQTTVPSHIDRLYMDCNSMLYDAFHNHHELPSVVHTEYVEGSPQTSLVESSFYRMSKIEEAIETYPDDFESRYNSLIDEVIRSIESYVNLIRPRQLVYIAFDGVAPKAKMNQQRQRRYKSEFLSERKERKGCEEHTKKNMWTTTMFTPGTQFMTMLTTRLKHIFGGRSMYIVSASDEAGEGEHKMTQHVRENIVSEDTIAWYGLDSDLIMLAMLHCRPFREFYLFRETPEFASAIAPAQGAVAPTTSITKTTSKKPLPEIMYMNVHRLAMSVYIEIMQADPTKECSLDPELEDKWRRVYDYVFLCFFLGNDFLPHFPALNLRTHGIQVLVDTYRAYIVKPTLRSRLHPQSLPVCDSPTLGLPTHRFLVDVDTCTLQWKQIYVLVEALVAMEHELILKEYVIRDKQERNTQQRVREESAGRRDKVNVTPGSDVFESQGGRAAVALASNIGETKNESLRSFEQLPILLRGKEKYIAPQQVGWESRYYRALFHDKPMPSGISRNYVEALEWVFTYYVAGCSDWQWYYRYEYPPLLYDMIRQIPSTSLNTIQSKYSSSPASSIEQLQFVLPPSQHHLIPGYRSQTDPISAMKGRSETSRRNMNFEWAFCKYFWESHFHGR